MVKILKFEDIDEVEINRRVTLVANRLLESFALDRFDKVGAYQLINRFLLLFQHPVIIVIHKLDNGEKSLIWHTAKDVHDEPKFLKYYLSLPKELFGRGSGLIYQPFSELEYGFSIHRVNLDQDKDTEPKDLYIPILAKENGSKPLDPFSLYIVMAKKTIDLIVRETSTVAINLPKFFESNLDKIAKSMRLHVKDSTPSKISNFEQDFIDNIVSKTIGEGLNELYLEYRNSPLLLPFKDHMKMGGEDFQEPINIAFSIKCFDRSNSRFLSNIFDVKDTKLTRYDYNSKWILPPAQLRDIKIKLHDFKKVGLSKIRSKLPKFPDSIMDGWFWEKLEMLEEGKEEQEGGIIDLATRDCAISERSFADRCLSTGLVQFYMYPHDNPRAFAANNQKTVTDLNATAKRAVCQHYLFSILGGCQYSHQENKLMLLSAPVRVNGAPFGCITTVAQTHSEAEIRPFVNADTFNRNYLYYHGVMGRVLRVMRDRSKLYYKDCILRLMERFKEIFISERSGFNLKNDGLLFEAIIESLNSNLLVLNRIFPYPLIQFDTASNNKNYDEPIQYFRDRREGGFDFPVFLRTRLSKKLVIENQYFDRIGDRVYLSPKEVVDFLNRP